MSSRRRHNAIQWLHVNGVQVEGVQNIRDAVYCHFSAHYKALSMDRPRVKNLKFNRLTMAESSNLI